MQTLSTAYLLHSSLKSLNTLEVCFLSESGKMQSLLFGAKKYKNILRQFAPLEIMLNYKKNSWIIENVELAKPGVNLTGKYLFSALYINELILEFTQINDEIYLLDLYETTIDKLHRQEHLEITLREFELEFLSILGYELNFSQINQDFILKHQIKTQYLADIQTKNWHDKSLMEAKKILRQVINYYLNGKELKSRLLFG
jgi:DNA repair protein RecO (recombination protein O)